MKINKVNTKFVAIVVGVLAIVGCVLCLGVNKNFAGAADSPSLPSATMNGFVFQINGAQTGDISKLTVSGTSSQAQGVSVDTASGESCVASFEVSCKSGASLDDYSQVSFSVGAEKASTVAGNDVRIYVTHHDGTSEVLSGSFNNSGVCSFSVSKLSTFSIVTNATSGSGNGTSGSSSSTNTSSTSPQTGQY